MADEIKVGIDISTKADARSLTQLNTELKAAEKNLAAMAANDAGWQQQAAQVAQLKGRIASLNAQTKPLAEAQEKAAKGAANFGQAMLQGSRGVQDFQAAGLNGMINNVEGLAGAFGASATAAGAFTLAFVAIQAFGPQLSAWFKSLDTEGKALDDLKTRMEGAAKTILGEWTPATEAADEASRAFTENLQSEKSALDALEGSLRTSLDLLRERARMESDIAKDAEAAQITAIKAKNLPKDEEARQIARVQIDRINADKQRAEGVMQAEQTAAGENLANASGAASRAAAQKKKLEDERQRSLLFATLETEIGGASEVVDKDGNVITPAKKGAAQRVMDAQAGVTAARGLEGDNTEALAYAEGRLAQEQQRLADLIAERRANIAANGGSENFRDIKTIDGELNQARGADSAAGGELQAARKAKAELDARQFIQRQKLSADYARDTGKVLSTLPADATAPRVRSEPDMFDMAERAAPRARRDLLAEEAAGMGRKSGGRDLVAEEAKAAAESNASANAAVLEAFKKLQADNKRLTDQLKNSRA